MAAVQGNLDQRTKWQSHQFDANFDRHWQPTLGLSEADLVVWPEASFTDFRENRPNCFVPWMLWLASGVWD